VYEYICLSASHLKIVEPKQAAQVDFLYLTVESSKTYIIEYCVILIKRLKSMEIWRVNTPSAVSRNNTIWCVNTPSAVSHNFTNLPPHKPMCFDQVRALPHIHYTLGSW
jgi:hypothetical protein